MRPTRLVIGSLGVIAAVTGTAPPGHAAGFGPVRNLTPATGSVDSQHVAVGPSGETAVMWRRFGPRVRDFEYFAAVGRNPRRLGRPQVVRAGRRAAVAAAGATLMARPGGGFAACFNDDMPHRTAIFGCSFSAANGRFGPLHIVERRSMRQNPHFEVAMRADGKVAVALMRNAGSERRQLITTTVDARGARGPLRPFAMIDRRGAFSLATTDDGITAIALSTPQRSEPNAPWSFSLRLTEPGQDIFGSPQPILEEAAGRSGSWARLTGGRELRIFVSNPIGDVSGPTILRRLPEGTLSGPLRLPRPAPGSVRGPVVTLPDGAPLAVVGAQRENETDCANTRAGVVGAGPVVPVGQNQLPGSVQRLSKPGQIALDPIAATLTDGTVIASWQNAASRNGTSRQEVAIRPPGASRFRRSQVLPQLAGRDATLAAGGNHAVLTWIAGDLPDGPSRVVVSSLRKSPPYAAPAPLPKRPRTPCG